MREAPVADAAHSGWTTDSGFDLNACERLMRGGSKSFFAASLVLPSRVRAPATALYAFCRLADDTIDIHAASHGGPAGAIRHLHDRLDRIYAGDPMPFDGDRALACVVHRFAIPAALPLALLDGFAWDMDDRRYETIADLHDYAARVAGTVGAMMAIIMGTRDARALARACELGVAMQLTNIARDVGEDARLGRLYLPRQWMREAGVCPEAWLRNPGFTPALGSVVQRLLANADELYRRAELGISALPRDCRPAIQAARLVYAEIGREVERAGYDSVTRRAFVSKQRKLTLMARALSAALVLPASQQAAGRAAPPALPAIQYLVDAGMARPAPAVPSRAFGHRALWVIGLFERLQQQQIADRSFAGSGEHRRSALVD